MNTVILWCLLVTVAAVLIFGVRPSRRGEWNEEFLSLSVSKGILGICAILIVFHHSAQMLGNLGMDAGPLKAFENVGVVFVGMFFFFSGFGLLKSLHKKEDYLKGFFRKRFPTVLIPFFICNLIFYIHNLRILPAELQPQGLDHVKYLLGWWLLNSHMWYVVEITILYLAFYFIFRLIKKESVAMLAMTVFTVAMIAGSACLNHGDNWFMGEWWFNSTFLFLVGMYVARSEEKLVSFAKRFYVLLLVIFAGAAAGFYVLTDYVLNEYSYYAEYGLPEGDPQIIINRFICLGSQVAMVLAAVCLLLLIGMKLRFHNPVLDFIGEISLELYLIHNLFFDYTAGNPFIGLEPLIPVNGAAMLVGVVLGGSFIAAVIIHFAIRPLVHLAAGKKKKSA